MAVPLAGDGVTAGVTIDAAGPVGGDVDATVPESVIVVASPAAGEAAPFAEKATGGTTSIRTADSGIVRSESVFA